MVQGYKSKRGYSSSVVTLQSAIRHTLAKQEYIELYKQYIIYIFGYTDKTDNKMKMQSTSLKIVNQATVGSYLKSSIEQAYVQGRLSFGVFEVAKRLERYVSNRLTLLLLWVY